MVTSRSEEIHGQYNELTSPFRMVHCTDAINWLQGEGTLHGASIITSLPDISEFPRFSLEQWKDWFITTSALILKACPDDGVTIFFQSDIRVEGVWVDKGYLCQKAAEETGHSLLWKRIICRAPPGTITFGRPSYSQLLCFSKNNRETVPQARADVVPDPGDYEWTRGMSTTACERACQYILNHTSSRKIVNPFCGQGTILREANRLGLDAVGIELSRKRAEKSRQI